MRVGLDARTLASSVRSGVEHYVANLVRAFATFEDGPEIIAYVDRPIADPQLSAAASSGIVRTEVVRAKRGWLRAALPFRLWRDGVEIVHLPSTLIPPILPCPAVVTVHDLAWLHYPEAYDPADLRMQTQVVPRSIRRAAYVIAVSQSTADDISRHFDISKDRIAVTPLGVSAAFSPDGPGIEDLLPQADKLASGFILHTGGHHPRKNLPRLLQAYAVLKDEMPEAPPLVITGDATSSTVRGLRADAKSLGMLDSLIFPGELDEAIMARLYRSATVAVYPSLYEGFGLPIIEAMASGIPVVTSNRSSMPEVAGDAALLVDPERPDELAAALKRLLSEPDLRAELIAKGISRSHEFTWDRTARQTLELLLL